MARNFIRFKTNSRASLKKSYKRKLCKRHKCAKNKFEKKNNKLDPICLLYKRCFLFTKVLSASKMRYI